MYQSSITVGTLIDSVKESMGLYTDIDRAFYRDTLNECLAVLYREVIDERAHARVKSVEGRIAYKTISVPLGQATPGAIDIRGLIYQDIPLQYLPPDKFPLVVTADGNFYTLMEDGIHLTPTRSTTELHVMYTVRPQRYGAGDEGATVPFPNEYLSLLRAKLRGEAYKLANEDGFAAKWLGEYNHTLAAFAAAYGRKG